MPDAFDNLPIAIASELDAFAFVPIAVASCAVACVARPIAIAFLAVALTCFAGIIPRASVPAPIATEPSPLEVAS